MFNLFFTYRDLSWESNMFSTESVTDNNLIILITAHG